MSFAWTSVAVEKKKVERKMRKGQRDDEKETKRSSKERTRSTLIPLSELM